MKLYLTHKIFENLEDTYTLKEAKQKAVLFIKSVDDIEELAGDYWIQIAENWDLNVWWNDCTSCEATLYPCEKGEDGWFHDDTQKGVNVFEKVFPVDEDKLKDFLEYFENQEYYGTGVHYISGGFAHADYDGCDDEDIFLTLKWGVQNDVENRVNTENYTISINSFNIAEDNKQIYKLLSN